MTRHDDDAAAAAIAAQRMRVALEGAPKRRRFFPDHRDTFQIGEQHAAVRLAGEERGAWTAFAAHALDGLLANASQGFGERDVNWAKRAAELADDLLLEFRERSK